MEKSEMMRLYEEETGKSARDELYSGSIKLYMPTNDYIAWLESKAKNYYEAVETFQEIIRNQCDEISELKAQLTWRPVSEKLPEKEKPVYPKPWRNRRYNPYIVTDGHEARFAFFAEVSKDKWWFVNPHNHHEIKNVVAWKDASLGLPIPPAPEGE